MTDLKAEEALKMLEDFGQQTIQNMQKEKAQKVKNYKTLNQCAVKGQILFTGSSLMEQFPVCELAASLKLDKLVYNRGIGGFVTDEFLQAIDTVLFDLEPSKVFINIGTNDMRKWEDGSDWMQHLLENYDKILKQCKERLPDTEFYIMAYYPVNGEAAKDNPGARAMLEVRTNDNLALVNDRIAGLAETYEYHFINVNQGLSDEKGNLKKEFTIEGVHMYAEAYRVVFNNLKEYL